MLQWNKTIEKEKMNFFFFCQEIFSTWPYFSIDSETGRRSSSRTPTVDDLPFPWAFGRPQNKQVHNESSQVCPLHEAPHRDDFIGRIVNFTWPTNFDEFDLESDDMDMWRHFQFLIFKYLTLILNFL